MTDHLIESRGARLRRAAGIVLVAVLVAAACAFAGLWQWSRHVDRSLTAERVEANYGVGATALGELLGPDGTLPPDAEWTPVGLRGRYLTPEPVTLRNRPVEGRPAVRLLHPVEVTDGTWAGRVLVVDRGWVPTADGGPERRPIPPDGVVDLVVRLRPAEEGSGRAADGELQVRSIAPDAVVDLTGVAGRPVPVYGLLVSENGAPPGGVEALPPPETSLGNNLSYAFQWWVFGLGALGGAVVLIRRDHREHAAGRERPAAGDKRFVGRRRPTAEEEEDALLDAQLDEPVSRGSA